MGFLLGLLCIVLIGLIAVQIGRVSELATQIRGERESQLSTNRFHSGFGMVFMAVFLLATIVSAWYYAPVSLYHGPVVSASEHGSAIDFLFNVTLFFTGIVFVLCHILLFYFAWRYRERENTKAVFWAHNNKLEMIWMGVPAVVMTFLVIQGIVTWNNTMTDVPANWVLGKDYIEVEGTGQQFAWILRHPGVDNQLGNRDFRMIDNASNPLGQDWSDKRNHDDFMPDVLYLPVNVPVRVRITSKDVLHNFYLPQHRVKMDAVPGMPTYFIFKPTITTDEMRQKLSQDAEWQEPYKNDPEKKRWEMFDYELACAELCGKGHYSMRRIIKIVTMEEYLKWLGEQKPYFNPETALSQK
jgi:cytochrome c oxidase subunit 2